MENDRRTAKRKKFGFYMPVYDTQTQECIGYLSDISLKGFRLESPKVIRMNQVFSLRLDLTPDVSSKSYIVIQARSVWTQGDPIMPNEYLHGFEVISIAPDDQLIYQKIIDNYGQG
jgi:hypothetical protein